MTDLQLQNPPMKRPQRFLVRMILFVLVVVGLIGFLHQPLQEAFLTNAPLNGLIAGVLVLGIGYNFRQVIMLYPEVNWIDHFRQNRSAAAQANPPRLLAPMAAMVGEHGDRLRLNAIAMRSLLDGIASRLDESRDISRYTIGLLIFLGLLGTFWGLLETVSSIRGVIGGLQVGGGEDLAEVFRNLKAGLEQPLSGMGTAFSSSLFGLAGSLALGFLDLQASQAQNRFFNQLEEWLSSVTRLSSGPLSVESDHSIPAYVHALLEQTADSLENLQRTLARGEESRIAVNNSLNQMSEHMATLSDHMRTEQVLMKSMAESQASLHAILKKISEAPVGGGMDDTTKAHIRNVDLQMGRLVEDLQAGREETLQQVRSEIRLLARTIANLADEADQQQQ